MRSRETSMPLFDRAATEERPRLNASVQEEDRPRLKASMQRIYDAMKSGEWFTTTQLEQIGGRSAPQRVHDLKKNGIPYQCERIPGGNGEHRWRLIGSPTNGIG